MTDIKQKISQYVNDTLMGKDVTALQQSIVSQKAKELIAQQLPEYASLVKKTVTESVNSDLKKLFPSATNAQLLGFEDQGKLFPALVSAFEEATGKSEDDIEFSAGGTFAKFLNNKAPGLFDQLLSNWNQEAGYPED